MAHKPIRTLKQTLNGFSIAAAFCVLLLCSNASAQWDLEANVPDDQTLKLLDAAPYQGTVSPTAGGAPAARYRVYVVGTDIYGNNVYINVESGNVPALGVGESFDIGGGSTKWIVPNDGTLFNVSEGGYRFVIAIYPFASPPTTLAELTLNAAVAKSGRLFIDVIPNIAIDAPGVAYRAGIYRGGDVAQFKSSYLNSVNGESGTGGTKQSRPLRPGRDRYTVAIRLSNNAEYHEVTDVPVVTENDSGDGPAVDEGGGTTPPTTVADDFSIFAATMSGDLGGAATPDGYSPVRKVEVFNPSAPLAPYGLSGPAGSTLLAETRRTYTPQPYDGWLDLGEEVVVWTEQLIPQNYTGIYFVASRVQMNNSALDSSTANNTFVSDAANKIEIEEPEAAPPALEMASSVPDLGTPTGDGSTATGAATTSGGNAPSDNGKASGDGGVVVFSSRATDLALTSQGPSKGQQIFLRYRQSRETQLASRTVAGVQANKDCSNPSISANGRYIAYDSTATNLDAKAKSGRSMVYVYDKETFTTVVVSKNASDEVGNGSSFRPSLSDSGRFVTFESEATNLDPPVLSVAVTGGALTRITPVRKGFGFKRSTPPTTSNGGLTILGTGQGAVARAVVDAQGRIARIDVLAGGTGYGSNTQVLVTPPTGGPKQTYLHDRDTNGDGVFDEDGKTATYLVSVSRDGLAADGMCNAAVVNLNDGATDLTANGGMLVAFVSYALNLPSAGGGSGNAMVYRSLVDVTSNTGVQVVNGRAVYPGRGAVAAALEPVSVNDLGEVPSVPGGDVDSVGAQIVPFAQEPAINGDGSQIAFTSAGVNLVYNEQTGDYSPTYANLDPQDADAPPVAGVVPSGDYNRVPDVFVRDMNSGETKRVSVSLERVATGTIAFAIAPWSTSPQPGGTPAGNIPPANGVAGANQVAADDRISISDGAGGNYRFVFDPSGALPPQPGYTDVPVAIGANIQQTRDNLVDQIEASMTNIDAFAVTPPNSGGTGAVGYRAGVYLRNRLQGSEGNQVMLVNDTVQSGVLGGGANGNIYLNGMRGGGTQAEEDARFPGLTDPAPIQDVPLGSGQPSIDRSGRFVAFRSVCVNLDVFVLTNPNNTPVLAPFERSYPITGELIRPLSYTLNGNVYLHDRSSDGRRKLDRPGKVSTKRVSVNKFGYPTNVYPINAFSQQALRFNFTDTANSSNPSLSADGRFVIFSSDSEGRGGLDFGDDNLAPLDNTKVRDVFIQDRFTVGQDPPLDDKAPTVAFSSPAAVTGAYVTGSTVLVSVDAQPGAGKAIRDVVFTVNGAALATVTQQPYLTPLTLTNPGTYNVTAVVTDNFGVQTTKSVTIVARRAVGEAPTIAVTHPTPGGGGDTLNDFSNASSFYLNAVALAGSGAAIDFIAAINVEDGGRGYTSTPTVTISGGGGSGAVARAVVEAGELVRVSIIDGGSGYTSAPIVTISGGGGNGAVARAVVNQPRFFANGLPLGGNVVRIVVPAGKRGSGYSQANLPEVRITGGGGSGAKARAVVNSQGEVSSITLLEGGTGYNSAPVVTIDSPPPGGTRAEATAVLGGRITQLSSYYAVFWRPDVIGNYQITAQVSDSRGNTVVSDALEFEIAPVVRPLPSLKINPISSQIKFQKGDAIELAAVYKSNSATEVSRVDFYANGVLLGAWEPQDDDDPLTGTATFVWIPEESGKFTISARAMQVLAETGDNSVVSDSTVANIFEPVEPVPGSNSAFVYDLYKKLLYRTPKYDEWQFYTSRLSASGAAKMTKPEVVAAVMGYDTKLQRFNYQTDYGKTSAMIFAAYLRLGLKPNNNLVELFLDSQRGPDKFPGAGGTGAANSVTSSDLLPLDDYPSPGLGPSPYGATYGLSKAFQNILDSTAFFRKYPTVSGFTDQQFVTWLQDKIFTGRPLGQIWLVSGLSGGAAGAGGAANGDAGLMGSVPENISRGSAMAFFSRLVLAAYSQPEAVFQRQMAVSALLFQLNNGKWDPNAYKKYGLYSLDAISKILGDSPPVGGKRSNAGSTRSNRLTETTALRSARPQAAAKSGSDETADSLDATNVVDAACSAAGLVGSRSAKTSQQLRSLSGLYVGVVEAAPLNNRSGGEVRITANAKGVLTGRLSMGGESFALRGKISADGQLVAQATGLPIAPCYSLTMTLAEPDSSAPTSFSGVVSLKNGQKAEVQIYRSSWNAQRPAAEFQGTYDLVFAYDSADSNTSGALSKGEQPLAFIVDEVGNARMSGQLAPGVPLAWFGRLNDAGEVRLHKSLGARGSVLGRVLITTRHGQRSAHGSFSWSESHTPIGNSRPRLLSGAWH